MEFVNKSIALDMLNVSRANVRGVGKSKGIDRLAADILANGLIQPLTVYKIAGGYEIDAGFRRFSAIKKLSDQGLWNGPVACRVIPASASTTDREAISLAENMGQLPMHPLDRARVLARFVARGMTPADVAARFGLDVAEVEKVLRLQRLALPIRAALAEGRISESIAFALAEPIDRTAQMAVFGQVQSWWKPSDVKRALNRATKVTSLPMQSNHRLYRAFVADYTQAGGQIEADLFTAEGEGKVDGALVRRIAEAKLKASADALRNQEGLAWAAVELNANGPGDFEEWDETEPCPVPAGVVAYVNRDGVPSLAFPLIRRADWDRYEADCRAAIEAEERAALDALDLDSDGARDPDEDEDEDNGDEAPAPVVDYELQPRAPSRPMNTDTETALTGAIGNAMRLNFGVAFDTFLHSVLTDVRAGKSALAFRAQLAGGVGLPDDLLAETSGVADLWSLIDSWTEARKRDAFAAIIGAMARANTDQFAIDRPAPTRAAVVAAQRLGVDMHRDWQEADREAYLARMSKHDLCFVVRAIPTESERVADALALPKDAAIRKAMGARWVPAYFADVASKAPALELVADTPEPEESPAEDAPEAPEAEPLPIAAE